LRGVGGFVDEFRGLYDDQAVYMKLGLEAPILVAAEGWYRYRHHPDSCCAVAFRTGTHDEARRTFLAWATRYLESRPVRVPEIDHLVRGELARLEPPRGLRKAGRAVARIVLPAAVRGGALVRHGRERVGRTVVRRARATMKVVQAVGWFYPDTLGGTEVYVAGLCRRLRRAGHEPIVAAPDASCADERTYAHEGTP